MAVAQPRKIEEEIREKLTMKNLTNTGSTSGGSTSGNAGGTFKFNVQAPEFVPKSYTQVPISGYYYPYFHYLGGSDWFFVGDQEPVYVISNPTVSTPNCSKNVLGEDLRQKIVKQVSLLIFFSFIL